MNLFYENRLEPLFVGDICDHPFPAHVHEIVEIVFMMKGELTMTIGGKTCHLTAGDIGVVFPSVYHSYDETSADIKGLALLFMPGIIQEYLSAFHTLRPICPFLLHSQHKGKIDSVAQTLYALAQTRQTPLILGYLHVFLAYLFMFMPLTQAGKSVDSGIINPILQYISEHYTERLTLDSTARALGISRSHLSHVFSQQLHISLRQYINTLRIDKARLLLQNPDLSITQITYMCGYDNSRTFHRAFLSECGMQPSVYRLNVMNPENARPV